MVGVEVLRHPDVSGIATAAWWSLGRPEEIRARRSLALPRDMEERGRRSAARSRWFMGRRRTFNVQRSTFNVQRATCNVQPCGDRFMERVPAATIWSEAAALDAKLTACPPPRPRCAEGRRCRL